MQESNLMNRGERVSKMQESPSQKPTGKNNTNIFECPGPFARWYCLNGATCFSLNIQNSTIYNCWCPKGFHGSRCDYKYTTAIGTTERYQEEIKDVSSSIETRANETSSSDSIQDDQFAFILTVSQHSNTKINTFGSISRRYTKGIHSILLEAIIVFLAITLLMLITRYVRRKLLSDQNVTMRIPNTSNTNSLRHRSKNEVINQDGNHESINLEMEKIEPQSRHHPYKQQVRVQSFEPPPLDSEIYHNQHHYCQNHQTLASQISDNIAIKLHQISLMNFDHL